MIHGVWNGGSEPPIPYMNGIEWVVSAGIRPGWQQLESWLRERKGERENGEREASARVIGPSKTVNHS